jgi:hypothetical protein
MSGITSRQFGLIIAYILPGFIGLAGMVPLFPVVGAWLHPINQGGLDFGAPLYALLAATALGMILSCCRWLIVDRFHHWTGVQLPEWNDSRLDDRLDAFDYLVEVHYRYYQFYANTLVAIFWAYGVTRLTRTLPLLGLGTDLAALILCFVLFVGSRDALTKYYTRTSRLLGPLAEKDFQGKTMTNGNHHDPVGGASSPRPRPEQPSPAKEQATTKPEQSSPTKAKPEQK